MFIFGILIINYCQILCACLIALRDLSRNFAGAGGDREGRGRGGGGGGGEEDEEEDEQGKEVNPE